MSTPRIAYAPDKTNIQCIEYIQSYPVSASQAISFLLSSPFLSSSLLSSPILISCPPLVSPHLLYSPLLFSTFNFFPPPHSYAAKVSPHLSSYFSPNLSSPSPLSLSLLSSHFSPNLSSLSPLSSPLLPLPPLPNAHQISLWEVAA